MCVLACFLFQDGVAGESLNHDSEAHMSKDDKEESRRTPATVSENSGKDHDSDMVKGTGGKWPKKEPKRGKNGTKGTKDRRTGNEGPGNESKDGNAGTSGEETITTVVVNFTFSSSNMSRFLHLSPPIRNQIS